MECKHSHISPPVPALSLLQYRRFATPLAMRRAHHSPSCRHRLALLQTWVASRSRSPTCDFPSSPTRPRGHPAPRSGEKGAEAGSKYPSPVSRAGHPQRLAEGKRWGERCLPHDQGLDASANVTSGIGPTLVTTPGRPTLHPAWSRSVAPDRARREGWPADRGRARPDRPACPGRSSPAGPRGR